MIMTRSHAHATLSWSWHALMIMTRSSVYEDNRDDYDENQDDDEKNLNDDRD